MFKLTEKHFDQNPLFIIQIAKIELTLDERFSQFDHAFTMIPNIVLKVVLF